MGESLSGNKNNPFAVSVLIFLAPLVASMIFPELPKIPYWMLFLSIFLIGFVASIGMSMHFSSFFAGGVLFLSVFVAAFLVLPVSGGIHLPAEGEWKWIVIFSALTLASISGAWINIGLSTGLKS